MTGTGSNGCSLCRVVGQSQSRGLYDKLRLSLRESPPSSQNQQSLNEAQEKQYTIQWRILSDKHSSMAK